MKCFSLCESKGNERSPMQRRNLRMLAATVQEIHNFFDFWGILVPRGTRGWPCEMPNIRGVGAQSASIPRLPAPPRATNVKVFRAITAASDKWDCAGEHPLRSPVF